MESRHFGIGTVPYRLEAVLIKAGSDVVVVAAGGTKPHIGATAVAAPRSSLTGRGNCRNSQTDESVELHRYRQDYGSQTLSYSSWFR